MADDEVERQLGGDPAASVATEFGVAVLAGLLFLGVTWWLLKLTQNGIVLIIALITGGIGLLSVGAMLVQIPLAVKNRYRCFCPAVEAVRRGELQVTWAAQGRNGYGVLVVDQPGRCMWADGVLVAFENVREVRWQMQSGLVPAVLEVVLRDGERPVRRLRFSTLEDAMQVGERLKNALSLASEKSGGGENKNA